MSLTAAWIVHRTGRERDAARFANAVEATRARLDSRLSTYVTMLRGTSGLFAARGVASAQEFRTFINQFDIPRSFPGVQGIGFAQRLRHQELESFRRSRMVSGEDDYAIRPDTLRIEYFPIVYLEPLDPRNRSALGYDMFTEPTRRKAMTRARDSGRPTATGPVELEQEIIGSRQTGLLIYVPVYSGVGEPSTVTERRERLLGFVYAPFRVRDLFAGIFGERPPVAFRVYDGGSVDPARLVYDSRDYDPEELAEARKPMFASAETTRVFGHEWTVAFESLPLVEERTGRLGAPIVALAGLLISFLLAALTRREVEAALRAEESDRIRGRFFAAMSHELRTPLNAIIGYNDLLLLDLHGPLATDQRGALERSQRAARHLLELVNDVLDISKLEAGKVTLDATPTCLPELVAELFSTLEATAKQHGCTLDLVVDPRVPTIVSDPRRVRQIILNLLSNAIRFGSGHPIQVHCSGTREGGVRVEVRDQGPGIAPEDQERIFEEFVQLPSPVSGGTGLGLPISRRLALLLGGTLTVRSAPGHGSSFHLILPPQIENATA